MSELELVKQIKLVKGYLRDATKRGDLRSMRRFKLLIWHLNESLHDRVLKSSIERAA